MSYLARLKGLLAEKRPPEELTKPTKGASVSFVSDRGSHARPDEDAIAERAGLASDGVPLTYLDAWAQLNHQKPASVSEDEWRLALDDGGQFLDAWGNEAADTGWTPDQLFRLRTGLLWRLAGMSVERIGSDHIRLSDGRTIWRAEMNELARWDDGVSGSALKMA